MSHQRSAWFPDGHRIVFSASEPGRRPRLYVQEISGGAPRPISPEGVTTFWNAVSPDGKRVLVRGPDGKIGTIPSEGGGFSIVAGLGAGETPVRWSADGRIIYVSSSGKLPLVLRRIELESGKGEKWRELAPVDPAGVTAISSVRLTPDGRGYAYSYRRVLADLYLVEGLR